MQRFSHSESHHLMWEKRGVNEIFHDESWKCEKIVGFSPLNRFSICFRLSCCLLVATRKWMENLIVYTNCLTLQLNSCWMLFSHTHWIDVVCWRTEKKLVFLSTRKIFHVSHNTKSEGFFQFSTSGFSLCVFQVQWRNCYIQIAWEFSFMKNFFHICRKILKSINVLFQPYFQHIYNHIFYAWKWKENFLPIRKHTTSNMWLF